MIKLNDFERIIIYQYGKVGSSTMRDSLREYHKDVHHVHFIIKNAKNWHLLSNNKILIINIVRNTYDRNISNLFQNISNKLTDFYYCEPKHVKNVKLNNLMIHFRKANCIHIKKLLIPWYTNFKETIGIDILAKEFDTEKKYNIYELDNKTVLTLRFEDIADWGNILSTLFNETIQIKKSNITKDKLYNKFKKQYKFSPVEHKLINKIDHFHHFYTQEEIEKFKKKYR